MKDFLDEYLDLCLRHGYFFVPGIDWIQIDELKNWDCEFLLNQIDPEIIKKLNDIN